MVQKRGTPDMDELVICTIKSVNPNSAFASIDEYQKLEGMIHISEISSGWVRDIKQFVRKGQTVVAKVIKISADKNYISLSLKRVDKKQENRKLKEYKLSQRAEKMLEIVGKELKKTINESYNEVGFLLQEQFGSLYDAFKVAATNPGRLKDRGVPDKWVALLHDIAKKNIEQKEYVFRAELMLKSVKPDGINQIKKFVADAKKTHIEISYIAAPEYLVKFKTKHAKKGEKEFEQILENLVATGKKDFEIAYKRV